MAASAIERALDDEIERLDHLQGDELEEIRRRRLAVLKRESERRERLRLLGHGSVSTLRDQKEFFDAGRSSDRMVCVFMRQSFVATKYGELLLRSLGELATRHVETRFVTLDAEKSPWICERLGVYIIPSFAIVKKEKVSGIIHGMDALLELDVGGNGSGLRMQGASGIVSVSSVERALLARGAIQRGASRKCSRMTRVGDDLDPQTSSEDEE